MQRFRARFPQRHELFPLGRPSGGDKDRQCCFATLFPPRLNRFETPQDNNGHREQNEPERNIAGANQKPINVVNQSVPAVVTPVIAFPR